MDEPPRINATILLLAYAVISVGVVAGVATISGIWSALAAYGILCLTPILVVGGLMLRDFVREEIIALRPKARWLRREPGSSP